MAKIVSTHSFRGGTGKSNTTASVAFLLAKEGKRVGVIDTDIQSPGIHVLFGLAGAEISRSLNDYLWHDYDITHIAQDVTAIVGEDIKGRLYLIPSSSEPGQIARVLREGYDAERLTRGLKELLDRLELDVLMIDTHPGLNEETLLSLIISHLLIVIMRPDQQDYEGTGITVQVAQKLEVPRMLVVVNKVPTNIKTDAIKVKVEEAYQCDVAAVVPHSDEMMELGSSGIFAAHFPDNPITDIFRQIAHRII